MAYGHCRATTARCCRVGRGTLAVMAFSIAALGWRMLV
jgi:hypothetical protein